jgi:chaperonin GroEL
MVLTQAMTTKGLELTESNPVDLKRGIDLAVSAIVEKISNESISVEEDYDVLRQVATVSANNDTELANLIADAVEKVTKDGVVNVEYSKTSETHTEFRKGMSIDKGFIDPNLQMQPNLSIINDCNVLCVDEDIQSWEDLFPAINLSMNDEKPLVVVAKNVGGQALATVITNLRNEKNPLLGKVHIVLAPEMGSMRTNVLEDIAILTGGKMLSKTLGHSLKEGELTLDFFGQADKVESTRDTTRIIGGAGTPDSISLRIEELRELQQSADEMRMAMFHKQRIARLVGGVATIFVGADSDSEKREIKDRVDDALRAVGSAMEEGIVVGGGTFLLNSYDVLDELKSDNKDIMLGVNIVRESLDANTRKMMSNAGLGGFDLTFWEVIKFMVTNVRLSNIDRLISKVKALNTPNMGYNLETNEITNLMEEGIIDPAKVIRTSLQSAASVTGVLLSTDSLIVEDLDD